MAAILKNLKCYISTTIWLIFMKFDMVMYIGPNPNDC